MPQELQNRISLNINKTTAKGPALLVGIPNILPVSQDLSIGFVNLEVELPALLLWQRQMLLTFPHINTQSLLIGMSPRGGMS